MSESTAGGDRLEQRLRGGDTAALAELFSLHRQRLWRMISFRLDHRLAGRIDPDDVLQDAYLAAAQRLDHYRSRPSMSAFVWLRLIAGQTLIDAHRHHLGVQARTPEREMPHGCLNHTQSTSTSLAAQLAARVTSPSQAAARAETHDKLEQAIAAMDPVDQEILALRHFEELNNTEVAEVLGIQQKAASIRYVRAVRRLKEILGQLPDFSSEARVEKREARDVR